MTEFIQHESSNEEAWICVCGNTPAHDGFFPMGANGKEVEPTAQAWTTDELFCGRCGRVIHFASRRVTRQVEVTAIVRLA
jgi:hypothetical protein